MPIHTPPALCECSRYSSSTLECRRSRRVLRIATAPIDNGTAPRQIHLEGYVRVRWPLTRIRRPQDLQILRPKLEQIDNAPAPCRTHQARDRQFPFVP